MSALAFTTTGDAAAAASRVLRHSVERGDFEDTDFEDAVARAGDRCYAAAEAAFDVEAVFTEVVVDEEHFDEILSVLEADVSATTGLLARFIRDANAALG